jgi:hypothetical protein
MRYQAALHPDISHAPLRYHAPWAGGKAEGVDVAAGSQSGKGKEPSKRNETGSRPIND